MIKNLSVLLIFCEGPHDVAFVHLVLKHVFKFEKVTWKFSEFPSPFHSFFPAKLQQHAGGDLKLNMAHEFFLPSCVLRKDDQIILLFNSGGSGQVGKIKILLDDLLSLLENAEEFRENATSVVTESRFLFLYDADCKGAATILKEFTGNFSKIGGEFWFEESAINSYPGNPMAAKFADNIGVYIWGASETSGTLEDILMPLLQQSNKKLMDEAEKCIDSLFNWNMQTTEGTPTIAEGAKRKKAIITLAGQHKKPGASMSVVIDQADLIEISKLKTSAAVKAFSRFIKSLANL